MTRRSTAVLYGCLVTAALAACTPAPAPSGQRHSPAPASGTPSTTTSAPAATTEPSVPAPVIVLDPGHSVPVSGIDPRTGLDISDYENEPEMHDVFTVATLVAARLRADGYRVLMTKSSVDAPTTLGRRVEIADEAHAALAISIHDQAGDAGGIGFTLGNNVVYYQRVGDYREASSGRRTTFDDPTLAARSKRCGQLFAAARQKAEGHAMTLRGDTGYDLGSRGLNPGDIWTVQLLSSVVWIYNESGGNSVGQSGLDTADRSTYAAGLVAGVEACVPRPVGR